MVSMGHITQTGEGVQQIIDAVKATLQHYFPAVEVFVDEPEEDEILAPYFLVHLQKVSQQHELGRRYYRQHMFNIRYVVPEANRSNLALHQVAEQLYGLLESATHSTGVYKGSEMNHEIVDGVLHFYVDYSFHVVREKPAEVKMQEMKQEGNIHG